MSRKRTYTKAEMQSFRDKINKLAGYKKLKKTITTSDIFNAVGLDIERRREYNAILGLIQRDRDKFHESFLDDALEAVFKKCPNNFEFAYKYCLKKWYLKGRLLLYHSTGVGGKFGWITPKTLAEKQELEGYEMRKDHRKMKNRAIKMRKFDEKLLSGRDVKEIEDKIDDMGSLVEGGILEDKSDEEIDEDIEIADDEEDGF